MIFRILVLIFAIFGSLARAENPMTGAEFEAYTDGRTLFFQSQGRPYGVERYLPGRRVIWSFLDGECVDGIWYEAGNLICFAYETPGTPQCWSFYREANGLRALFENRVGETVLFETRETDEPMLCLGPKIGV